MFGSLFVQKVNPSYERRAITDKKQELIKD